MKKSSPCATTQSAEEYNLKVKLLSLYISNKHYIDLAEKFLDKSSLKERVDFSNDEISRDDIERLYAHIKVLEQVAMLLNEEFFLRKNGNPPGSSENCIDQETSKKSFS